MTRLYPYFRFSQWGSREDLLAWVAHFEAQGIAGAVTARALGGCRTGRREYALWRAGDEITGDRMHSPPNAEPLDGIIVDEWGGFRELLGKGGAR